MKRPKFQVSDKVVCVDASEVPAGWFTSSPVEGRVYVVRDITPAGYVKLVGIFTVQPADDPRRHSCSFDPTRFRKLEDVRAESARKSRRQRKKRAVGFQPSDKVVLIERVQSVDCFTPVPQVGRVYVVREALASSSSGQALRLVGIQGVHEAGEEVCLNSRKFRRLEEIQAQGARRRGKGGK